MLDERTINLLESIKVPNTYWKNGTIQYRYWFRSLLQKIDSSLIFSGLPSEWSNDFFMLCLWSLGFVAVFRSDRKDLNKYGNILFQPGVISGYDFYYNPSHITIANPYYENTLTIGKDTELIKLTPDFRGVLDIIDFYAGKLSELSKAIDVGLINAKMPVILTANSEAQCGTLKKVYDKIQAGESLVIYDELIDNGELMPRKDPFENWTQDFQKTYIVSELLDNMRSILDSFYTEIGLPVAIEKKERIITSEADFASAQSQARISCWLETLRESLTKVNTMFNSNISCEVAYNNNERKDNTNRDREYSKQDV